MKAYCIQTRNATSEFRNYTDSINDCEIWIVGNQGRSLPAPTSGMVALFFQADILNYELV